MLETKKDHALILERFKQAKSEIEALNDSLQVHLSKADEVGLKAHNNGIYEPPQIFEFYLNSTSKK